MRNHGTAPEAERVDLRFRNGQVVRAVDPRKYRWAIGDAAYPPDYAFDIASWQPAKP
jgi:hypothetical protein